jgi:hypothetical protein
LAVIDDLSEVFAKKEWKHDDEFAAALTLGRTYLDSETTARTGPSSVDLMRAASTSERMLEILQNLVSDRKLDRATAMAALCNPNANLEVAEIAAKAFGWGEPIKVLEAKHHELPVPVKVVLLSSSYGLSDEQIQKFLLCQIAFWNPVPTSPIEIRKRRHHPDAAVEGILSAGYAWLGDYCLCKIPRRGTYHASSVGRFRGSCTFSSRRCVSSDSSSKDFFARCLDPVERAKAVLSPPRLIINIIYQKHQAGAWCFLIMCPKILIFRKLGVRWGFLPSQLLNTPLQTESLFS